MPLGTIASIGLNNNHPLRNTHLHCPQLALPPNYSYLELEKHVDTLKKSVFVWLCIGGVTSIKKKVCVHVYVCVG